MTIRTFDAVPLGTVPGATLFQLNEQRAEEGELCYTEDYHKLVKAVLHLRNLYEDEDFTVDHAIGMLDGIIALRDLRRRGDD